MRPRSFHAIVRGTVQGVGFRWFVQRTANRLGLAGWVRNRKDGTVEVYAEGDDAMFPALADALRQGPGGARVTHLDVEHGDPRGLEPPFLIDVS